MANKKPAGGEADQSSGRRAESTETLQVRRQRADLDAIPSNTRVDRHVGDCHSRRRADQESQRHRSRQVPVEGNHQRRNCANNSGEYKIRAAAISSERENIGEDAPEWFDDPGNVVQPNVQLDDGGLDFLDVFPVVIGDYFEERSRKALTESVHYYDAEYETWIYLGGEHLQPPQGLEEYRIEVGFRRVVVDCYFIPISCC